MKWILTIVEIVPRICQVRKQSRKRTGKDKALVKVNWTISAKWSTLGDINWPGLSSSSSRCGTCFDCPSCGQSLTIRATTIQAPLEEDKTKLGPKKLYYLACGFCRWTSRDVGLEDSLSTTGPWKEPECDKGKEFEHVLANMRLISLREKMLKEKKFVQRSKYLAAVSLDKLR